VSPKIVYAGHGRSTSSSTCKTKSKNPTTSPFLADHSDNFSLTENSFLYNHKIIIYNIQQYRLFPRPSSSLTSARFRPLILLLRITNPWSGKERGRSRSFLLDSAIDVDAARGASYTIRDHKKITLTAGVAYNNYACLLARMRNVDAEHMRSG